MRILVAGGYKFDIYESACVDALGAIGHDVRRFDWSPYLQGWVGRLEDHFNVAGPRIRQLNAALVRTSIEWRPDVVLVWRGTHVAAATINAIRLSTGAFVAAYNNDDPFCSAYASGPTLHLRRLWRIFVEAIPAYDMHFAYRRRNLRDFSDAGARRVSLLPPYFIPERDRPVELTDDERRRFGCDVAFAGHFEPDGRLECLSAMAAAGLTVKLYGTGWTRAALGSAAALFGDVAPARGDDYIKALCGAGLCLAFMSKLNRDTYTRRTFEIPATGSVMLSEYSEDLAALFEEDVEFLSFRSNGEAVEKARAVAGDSSLRSSIGAAARRRSLSSGYDIRSRMHELVGAILAASDR